VKKCSFLGFFSREPRLKENAPEPHVTEIEKISHKKRHLNNCTKSKAYLLSLVRHLYSTRLSHIYIERYIITSHV
jgi:hypothetical protein